MFKTRVVDKIKTQILCSITLFENRAAYKIIWKNIVEPGRPQMAIWRMRVVTWILTATNTHLTYVILTAFLLQKWLHEYTSMVLSTFIACLAYIRQYTIIF